MLQHNEFLFEVYSDDQSAVGSYPLQMLDKIDTPFISFGWRLLDMSTQILILLFSLMYIFSQIGIREGP